MEPRALLRSTAQETFRRAGWIFLSQLPHTAEAELGFHLYYPLFLSNFLEENWREQNNKHSH